MEAEAFLLGHWKNYQDLEESLSLEELTVTVNAARRREEREQRFHAALQGVDLGEASSGDTKSFEDVWQEATGTKRESFSDFGIAHLEPEYGDG